MSEDESGGILAAVDTTDLKVRRRKKVSHSSSIERRIRDEKGDAYWNEHKREILTRTLGDLPPRTSFPNARERRWEKRHPTFDKPVRVPHGFGWDYNPKVKRWRDEKGRFTIKR